MKEGIPISDGDKVGKDLSNTEKILEYEKQGYVYIFEREPFTLEEGWQVKSKKPVKPVDVIEVEFTDFEKLGGIVEWK